VIAPWHRVSPTIPMIILYLLMALIVMLLWPVAWVIRVVRVMWRVGKGEL
jgi:hypothetical protein